MIVDYLINAYILFRVGVEFVNFKWSSLVIVYVYGNKLEHPFHQA